MQKQIITGLAGLSVLALKGAVLRVLDGREKVVAEVDLPTGPLSLADYAPLEREGIIQIEGCSITANTKGRLLPTGSPHHFSSGANSDFEPSSERREELKMRRMFKEVVDRKLAENDAKRERRDAELRKERRKKERDEAKAAEAVQKAAEAAAEAAEAERQAKEAAASEE